MTTRAYSYIRWSHPDQAKGDSLRRQLALTEAYCTRHGLHLDASLTLRDMGVSAFKGDNAAAGGALGAFLEAVKAGKVPKGSRLVIEKLDRYTRLPIGDALELFLGLLRSGIDIATTEPESLYTRASINEIGVILNAVVNLFVGHEESKKKSERLSQVWKAKRERAKATPLSHRCPNWLVWREGKFQPRPEAVAIVKEMIRLTSEEGVGIDALAKKLNAEGRTLRGKRWASSSVRNTLMSRALLGEYQPCSGRKPVGDPLPSYYPAVISEAEFWKAQQAIQSRRRTGGRQESSQGFVNLFSGLLYDARDGSRMAIINGGRYGSGSKVSPNFRGKPVGRKVVSTAARYGVNGSKYLTFPLAALETGVLSAVTEITFAQLFPSEAKDNNAGERVAELSGRLSELNHKIEQVQSRILSRPDVDVLLTALEKLDAERKATLAELETAQGEASQTPAADLGEAQNLIGLLANASGQEQVDLRKKVQAVLRQLVKDVWLLVNDWNGQREALAEILFATGATHSLTITKGGKVKRDTWTPEIPDESLRHMRHTERGAELIAEWDDLAK